MSKKPNQFKMKTILSVLLSLYLGNILYSQTDIPLSGVVVEMNSKYKTGSTKYLRNVQIQAIGSTPQLSNGVGEFTLVFTDRPLDNKARITASIKGYKVVNAKEVQSATVVGRKSALKIVMCLESELVANQTKYYNIAKESIEKEYKKQILTLQQEGAKKLQLIKELEKRYNTKLATTTEAIAFLREKKEQAELRVIKLVEKFASINLDDQSELYKKAFRLFSQGNLDGAIELLENEDIEGRLKQNTENVQELNSSIQLAEFYVLNNEYLKAEEQYELAIQYDSSNHELLYTLGTLYYDRVEYSKAEKFYLRCLGYRRSLIQENEKANKVDLALILNKLGTLYHDKGEYRKSAKFFLECLKYDRSLFQENEEAYKPYLASTLNNLGLSYFYLREYNQSEKYYLESLGYYRSLFQENKKVYKLDIAKILNRLGELLYFHKDYNQSEKYYLESLEYYKQLQHSTGKYSDDIEWISKRVLNVRSQMD